MQQKTTDESPPNAAKALLARVYLFYTGYEAGKFDPQTVTAQEVLKGLEEVIASGEYELVPEFKNLWPAASSTPVQGQLEFNSTYAGTEIAKPCWRKSSITHRITAGTSMGIVG